MATSLYYDNKLILAGQPTPIVGREDSMVRYGERWADQTKIILNGQITGCIKDTQSLIFKQQELIDVFSRDFQSFRIVEDGEEIYNAPYSIVKGGIEFPSSNYAGLLNYTVTLECYHENLFSGHYGVLDPKSSWSYEQTEDGLLEITHSLSARGFNTTSGPSNGFANAKAFVQSKTGSTPTVAYPTFIPLPSGYSPCLKEIRETPNRMNGTYAMELRYQADIYNNTPGLLRYSAEYECDQLEGVASVSIQGTYEGCFGQDMSGLRNRYKTFNVYDLALETYQVATSRTDLNPYYLSSGVTEDAAKKVLSFNVTFDNFTGVNAWMDYKVNINSGTNDVTTVDFEGTINARGDAKTRWERVSGYYGTINPYALANNQFISFGGGNPPLNPEPLSSGVTFNQFAGTINTNVSWNNKEAPIAGFSDFNYTTSYTPALERVVAKPLATNINGPICGSSYYVVDLGLANRVTYSINGDGKIKCGTSMTTAVNNLKGFANSLFLDECPQSRPLLEEHTISTGRQSMTFNFVWTAEGTSNVVIPRANYSQINNLAL